MSPGRSDSEEPARQMVSGRWRGTAYVAACAFLCSALLNYALVLLMAMKLAFDGSARTLATVMAILCGLLQLITIVSLLALVVAGIVTRRFRPWIR